MQDEIWQSYRQPGLVHGAGELERIIAMKRAILLLGLLALFAGSAARANAFEDDNRFVAQHDVQGVITYFNRFNMTVRVNGEAYPVVLHQGTIIRPTGATLVPSMVVNISGYWSAGTFFANRIIVVRS
jgi:hypothetical protein